MFITVCRHSTLSNNKVQKTLLVVLLNVDLLNNTSLENINNTAVFFGIQGKKRFFRIHNNHNNVKDGVKSTFFDGSGCICYVYTSPTFNTKTMRF